MVVKTGSIYDGVMLKDLKKTPNNTKFIEYLENYRDNIENKLNERENLIVIGNIGTGKSFILNALKNDLTEKYIEKNYKSYENQQFLDKTKSELVDVKYIFMFQLIKELRSDYNGKEIDKRWEMCDVLIIDEAGIQFGTEAERYTLFQLFEERATHYRATILISNYPLKSTNEIKGLDYYLGQRILDRLTCYPSKIFTLQGDSWRKKQINN